MEKSTKKNLIIRLIVYPISILIVVFLCTILWMQYKADHPKEAQLMESKLLGRDFCATPEEAVMKFSEALKNGNRIKAASYIYTSSTCDSCKVQKKYLYTLNKEEMKKLGEILERGHFKNDWSDEWVVEDIIAGKIVGKVYVNFVDDGYYGWKIGDY